MNYKKAMAGLVLVPLMGTATFADSHMNTEIMNTTALTASSAAKVSANFLAKQGVIVDQSNNTEMYNLESEITRREMIKVAMNISGKNVPDTCNGDFSDLDSDDFGCKYAEAALENGYIAANAQFRPDDLITEAESLKMIMQARGIAKAEGNFDSWMLAYSAKAENEGLINAQIKLNSNARRGWIFEAAAKSFDNFDDSELMDDEAMDDEAMDDSSITISAQVSADNKLTINSITMENDGWVVVHADNGDNGPVVPGIISIPKMVKAGTTENVEIMLKDGETLDANSKVWIMLHTDDGTIGEYEFDGKNGLDAPLKFDNGNVIVTSVMVNTEAGVEVGGAMMLPSMDIVENAMNANNVTTLVAAVQAADLVETLKSEGPFTVFAPTNAAFEKLPDGTVTTLLMAENKAQLADILTYHVVAGSYTSADLVDGLELTTVQGETLMFTINANGMLEINGEAMVETADVISSNGVTHVIDTVLMPAE